MKNLYFVYLLVSFQFFAIKAEGQILGNYESVENDFSELNGFCGVTVFQKYPNSSNYKEDKFFYNEYHFSPLGKVVSRTYFYPRLEVRSLVKDTITYDSIGLIKKILTYAPKKKIDYSSNSQKRLKLNKKIKRVKWGKLIMEQTFNYDENDYLNEVSSINFEDKSKNYKTLYRNEIDAQKKLKKRVIIATSIGEQTLTRQDNILTDSIATTLDTSYHYVGFNKLLLDVVYFDKSLNKTLLYKNLGVESLYFTHYYNYKGRPQYSKSSNNKYEIFYDYDDNELLLRSSVLTNKKINLQYIYEYIKDGE